MTRSQLIHTLTRRIAEFLIVFERTSHSIRLIEGDIQAIYDEANEEWSSNAANPNRLPPPTDEHLRAEHFRKCDEICRMLATTPLELFKVTFASWAALRVLIEQDIADLPERYEIRSNADHIAFEQYSPYTCSWEYQQLPCIEPKPGPELIGERLCYRDATTGILRECVVEDYGKGIIRGEWFLISDGEQEVHVYQNEMEEIWSNRVC